MTNDEIHLPARRIPGATYRLQFNRDFTFKRAVEILDYLKDLGVTDIYASPLFQAGPESTHGYDICCFGKINPNIGTGEEFERFNVRRRELGLGLLLDMVPNHMGADLSNGWWLDVLENGPESGFAPFFDIDWRPKNPALQNKVLLPVLGDHYGKVLERGELKLGFEQGKFFLGYYERRFPVSKRSLEQSLANEADPQRLLVAFNGVPGNPRSFDKLHRLIQQQHYRLAYWRVGSEEINYRRFFDVTELVSLKMELPEVFAASHDVILEWLKAGKISGLRIDHPDGLRDPKQYFERLQSHAARLAGVSLHETIPANDRHETCAAPEQCLKPREPLYIVAEKILSGDEPLPDDWLVDGTTGYDFLNRVNGLFVNGGSEAAFDRLYAGFVDCGGAEESGSPSFSDLVHRSKQQILETSLISELGALTHRLQAVAMNTRAGMDFTFSQLKTALTELIGAFPVYRTYLTDQTTQPSAADRAVIEKAVTEAKAKTALEPVVFEFLGNLLTLEVLPELEVTVAGLAREFVMRFQQLTGPVMAKGLEDTAFYNFNRLISLNEVGGDPGRFGVAPEEFHNANVTMAAHWPHTLLATATHDTKRGEDARARINVLSEIPEEWRDAVTRWRQWNAASKVQVQGVPAPTANDEYLLYQSLVGGLPELTEPGGLVAFRERVSAFMLKAMREAKANTSWLQPNQDYENAVQEFVGKLLSDAPDNGFLEDLRTFTRRVAFFGRLNSLGQTLLKITSPGVPDFYEGSELWDLSFVDPDNRRLVDFEIRARGLADLKHQFETSPATCAAELLGRESGEAKMFLIWRALALRNRRREVFDHGVYTPLPAFGSRKDHVCAFARTHGNASVIAIVPRLVCDLTRGKKIQPIGEEIWRDTFLPLPGALDQTGFRNVFTGETIKVSNSEGGPRLRLSELLRTFPVALLELTEKS